MCERISFGYKYKLIELSIQCCAECYQHKQDHMQIEYTSKINQIEQELRRTFNDCPIVIRKNQNILNPRLHSFELRYKRLMIFSKLNNGNFPKPQDIATLILCLSTKPNQEILTIKNNLTTYYNSKDLYSYLKQKSKSVKLPYKLVANQIEKIIRVGIRIEPIGLIGLKVNHVSQNAQNSELFGKRNSSRFKYKSQINVRKSNMKHSIVKQKQNFPDFEQEQYYKNYIKKSRNTSFDYRESKKNSHRRIQSILKKQVLAEKYSYLTKEMDKQPSNQEHIDDIFNDKNNKQYSFELLELSIDENEEKKSSDWNEQQQQKRRIEQGVNFKLLATHTQKQTSKKYSSEYKKFAEMLQKQLKQDQILDKQKLLKNSKSSFVRCQQKNKQKMVSSDSVSINSENSRSYFDISMKQLESKIQLLIFSTKKQINQANVIPPEMGQNEMGIIVENCVEQNKQQINLSTPIELKKYYEQGFVHEKIQGMIQSKEQKQMYLDNHYLTKYQELCKVLININEEYPQIFKQVLQNSNIEGIKLQNSLSEYSLVLFNSVLGVFVKAKLRIQLSFQYQGSIPHWALVVCQAIQPFLSQNSNKICEILKLITGAPIVKIAATDLRKIRKILVQSKFGGNQQTKQKVICTGNEIDKFQHCQMLQFKKHKDILQSEITYKYASSQSRQKIIESKTYQQFAIKYQTIMLWMYQSNFYHNQKIIKFQTNQEDFMKKVVNPTCKIKFSLFESSRIFLEFNQHQKLEKPNHILISKIIQRQDNIQLQPIGELHKKGNFFFQLSLEPAFYFVQISRCFGYEEVNSMHFYSSSPIEIHKFVVDYEENQQFLANL